MPAAKLPPHPAIAERLPAHALVFALALLVKAAFVLVLADVFFYGEELEKGTAAKAMLDGLGIPHHQQAYHYYEGGGFAVSHLKALAFLAVGENLLAHKLVALAFFAAVLGVGMALARELFGGRAGLWFALLLTFGPVSFQKLSLLSLGIHFEACLFVGLAMWITTRLVFRPQESGRAHFALLGVVVGLGTWFSYQLVLVGAWALSVLLVARWRDLFGRGPAGPGALLGLAGFALGALPLWIMATLVGDAVFDIHGLALSGKGVEFDRAARLRAFFLSLYTERSALEIAGAVVFPLALIWASLQGLLAREPQGGGLRLRTSFVLLFLAIFTAAYASSPFVHGRIYHFFLLMRLAPAWYAGTLLVAGVLEARLSGTGRRERIPALVCAGLTLGLGCFCTLAILVGGEPRRLAENWRDLCTLKGYAYAPYFAKLIAHLDGLSPEQRLASLLSFREEDRDWLRAEIATELFDRPEPDLASAMADFRRVVGEVDPGHEAAYEVGLGKLWMEAVGWDQVAALALAAELPAPERKRLCEALGRFGSGPHPTPSVLARELENGNAAAERAAFDRGLGWRLRQAFPLDPASARAWIAGLEPGRARAVEEGQAAARRAHRLGAVRAAPE
jgi:hypothetical protein